MMVGVCLSFSRNDIIFVTLLDLCFQCTWPVMQKKRDTKPELLRARRSKEAGTSGKYGWFVVSEGKAV